MFVGSLRRPHVDPWGEGHQNRVRQMSLQVTWRPSWEKRAQPGLAISVGFWPGIIEGMCIWADVPLFPSWKNKRDASNTKESLTWYLNSILALPLSKSFSDHYTGMFLHWFCLSITFIFPKDVTFFHFTSVSYTPMCRRLTLLQCGFWEAQVWAWDSAFLAESREQWGHYSMVS